MSKNPAARRIQPGQCVLCSSVRALAENRFDRQAQNNRSKQGCAKRRADGAPDRVTR